MTEQAKMTLEEMKRIVDEARDVEYLHRKAKQREWEDEQRAKAPTLLELLRRHLPVGVLREIEEFVCYKFACDCFREAAERDLTRTELRETLPAERWGEIEQLVDERCSKQDL